MSGSPSRWTLPLLRWSMGLFVALWGVDKLVAAGGAQRIFASFYQVPIGPTAVRLAGAAEVALGLLLAFGLFRVPVALVTLAVNTVSTAASWRQILDPWGLLGLGKGGSHLFLASIVLLAVSVVLVLEARAATPLPGARAGQESAGRDRAGGGGAPTGPTLLDRSGR